MTRCSGMFDWKKITVRQSCSYDDAVREDFRLFPNVSQIKEKQNKCLNLSSEWILGSFDHATLKNHISAVISSTL